MKPAYEIVRAEELRVGDYIGVISNPGSFFASERVSATDKSIGSVVIINCKRELRRNEPVLRQLPPERNPEVLMRALQNVCRKYGDTLLMDGPAWAETFANDEIEQAIRELESEAGR